MGMTLFEAKPYDPKEGRKKRNIIIAIVFLVIILALLYIARDFIAHHTHYPFLGAKPK